MQGFMIACVIAILGLACATSEVGQHWGESYTSLNEQMIANPNAGQEDDDGINVLEGRTVENVMTQYRKGQVETTPDGLPSSMVTGASGKSQK
jgi:hypothetical protein